MMKKLLLTGLMSVYSLSMYGQDEHDLRTEIQELDQQKCVENFIAKVYTGEAVEYNEICNCFDVTSINDLSDQQLKQIISAAVNIQRTHLPYEASRFSYGYNYKAMENTTLFLSHLDQHRPLIGIINDLYLRDRISRKSGDRKKWLVEDGIDMLGYYIDIIEGKKQFDHSHEGVLDRLVVQPKNLQQLKDMKQELSEQGSVLRKS